MGEMRNQVTQPYLETLKTEELNKTKELKEKQSGCDGLENNGVWTLRFDGSKTKQGAGAGFELVSPMGEAYLMAHRLQFPCTNNMAEYEALILGLLCAIKKGAKILHVFGDSYLVTEQVKKKFTCHDKRLKRYRNRVWDLMEDFDAFNIKFSYRANNQVANALAQAASSLAPIKLEGLKKFKVELTSIPSVPDNIQNFQVFEDDEHILKFLTNSDVFTAQIIDGEIDEEAEVSPEDIMNLKTNTIPKGMIELERVFDLDKFNKVPYQPTGGDKCEKVNIGTEENPKFVHIGKVCTPKERSDILSLMKEFPDVIAWGYEDLKTYDPSIITHTIPLKEGSKPFRQRQRPVNPLLEPLIFQEVKKLLNAKIIFPVRHSTWVANLVPVRKKSGEIRLCVDFRNLNRASEKDNYPLPSLDEVLQVVNGAQMMTFMDGYSGYNQVIVEEEDRLKTAFTTKWGTFAYKRMPFGLINAGATFQRAMDYAFKDLKDKCIIIYMDDITVFSKNKDDHVLDLRKVFTRCRRFGISLNPKKCMFGVTEGRLLGHIISEKGIMIDPERVEAISKLGLPASKKELKSFFGKVNFVRKFISAFAEIVKPMNDMLKKDAKMDWTPVAKKAFEEIKHAIVNAPVLVSPEYERPFNVYSFASDHACAAILTQKNGEGEEHPIAFMSSPFREAELNYPNVEKQAYALVKAVKKFRHYILRSKVHAIVPDVAIKTLLMQSELGERRGKWVATIQEYDIEIQPMKLVRGQQLAQTMASEGPGLVQQVLELEEVHPDEWYRDIINYLLNHRCPAHLNPVQKRALRFKSRRYMLQGSVLYKQNHEGIYLRCVGKEEARNILEHFHDKWGTGHGSDLATAHWILRAGYYWPTLFKDTHAHVKSCHICQTSAKRERNPAMPLQPITEVRPFAMWGLDFIGPINPPSSAQHRYILTATDYCTRWSEAQAFKNCTTEVVIKFLEERIVTRFGCPSAFVCDNGSAFISLKFHNWAFDYGIVLKFSSGYYPQGNGLAESTNKNLLTVIGKLLDRNPRDWHTQLRYALWADRTRVKESIGTSPYHLVYGQDPVFPIQLKIPTLRFMQEYYDEVENQVQARLTQLMQLDEKRDEALDRFAKHQGVVKRWFDRRSQNKAFRISDLVLYWDKAHEKKGQHDKFDKLWKGPFQIAEIIGDNAFKLKTLTGRDFPLPVNGQFLKHYFQA